MPSDKPAEESNDTTIGDQSFSDTRTDKLHRHRSTVVGTAGCMHLGHCCACDWSGAQSPKFLNQADVRQEALGLTFPQWSNVILKLAQAGPDAFGNEDCPSA